MVGSDGAETLEGALVLALLTGDEERIGEVEKSAGDLPASGVIGASFVVATRRTFPITADVRGITAYVKAVAARAKAHDQPIGRREAEAAIRAALGEPDLVQGMDPEDLLETQVVLLQLMVEDLRLSGPDLVDLVREGEALAQSTMTTPRRAATED
jgi:hypothetical protein